MLKLASKAYEEGLPVSAFTGSFKKYLDKQAIEYHSTPLVYKGNIFFFKAGVLVTCWQIPHKFKKAEKNAKDHLERG